MGLKMFSYVESSGYTVDTFFFSVQNSDGGLKNINNCTFLEIISEKQFALSCRC